MALTTGLFLNPWNGELKKAWLVLGLVVYTQEVCSPEQLLCLPHVGLFFSLLWGSFSHPCDDYGTCATARPLCGQGMPGLPMVSFCPLLCSSEQTGALSHLVGGRVHSLGRSSNARLNMELTQHYFFCLEKAMVPHSSTLAWKIPWMEEPGGLQSMRLLRVGHDWTTSLSLFTFLHWRRKWQPSPVFLPGESQGRGSLVGCRLWGCTESDTTGATWQLGSISFVFQ